MAGFYQITVVALMLCTAVVSGCAPRPLALPTGDGTPFAGAAEALDAATTGCREVRAVSAELGLSGRVGRTKLRGRAIVGLAAPDRIRLEALAPFGPPVFILAAKDGRATLLLPRDERVLEGERPDAIVEALAGVRLDPASLRASIAGCGLDAETASGGRAYGDTWVAVGVDAERTIYLQRSGTGWVVRGAETPLLTITYDELTPAARPARITIRSRAAAVIAEVRLHVTQLEIDPDLPPAAFSVELPRGAGPLTLEELRAAGPLGERDR